MKREESVRNLQQEILESRQGRQESEKTREVPIITFLESPRIPRGPYQSLFEIPRCPYRLLTTFWVTWCT